MLQQSYPWLYSPTPAKFDTFCTANLYGPAGLMSTFLCSACSKTKSDQCGFLFDHIFLSCFSSAKCLCSFPKLVSAIDAPKPKHSYEIIQPSILFSLGPTKGLCEACKSGSDCNSVKSEACLSHTWSAISLLCSPMQQSLNTSVVNPNILSLLE